MTADEYTLTTEEVRERFCRDLFDNADVGVVEGRREFDHWLAAHDAEVARAAKAEALEEAAQVAEHYTPGYSKHPDDPVIDRTKRAIADQIRKVATDE